jgi:hypothetical protein
MKTNYSKTEDCQEQLYSIETEERLETVNLPSSEIVEICCCHSDEVQIED